MGIGSGGLVGGGFVVHSRILVENRLIAKLGEPATELIPRNLSNWHRGAGYQRWEKDQEWLEDLRAEQEAGLDLLPHFVRAGSRTPSAEIPKASPGS